MQIDRPTLFPEAFARFSAPAPRGQRPCARPRGVLRQLSRAHAAERRPGRRHRSGRGRHGSLRVDVVEAPCEPTTARTRSRGVCRAGSLRSMPPAVCSTSPWSMSCRRAVSDPCLALRASTSESSSIPATDRVSIGRYVPGRRRAPCHRAQRRRPAKAPRSPRTRRFRTRGVLASLAPPGRRPLSSHHTRPAEHRGAGVCPTSSSPVITLKSAAGGMSRAGCAAR